MDDIYKHKAKKYKYKYLKLKQELEGGGDLPCKYDLPIKFDGDSLDFGPEISGQSGKLKIVTNYPAGVSNTVSNTVFNNFNKTNYTGIIFKHNNYIELYPILTSPDIVEYTKVVYACTIDKEVRNKLKMFKMFKNNHIKKKFPKCPIFNDSKSYGYIITENIKNIIENINGLIINIDLFKEFINDLINTLKVFIIPLHEAGYILNNIDTSPIKWDKTKKQVYFNITEITKDTNKYKDINNLISFITKLFILNNYHYTKELLKEFDKDKNMSINKLIDNLPKINECIKYEEEILEYKEKILENEQKLFDEYVFKNSISDKNKIVIRDEITRLTEIEKQIINKINEIILTIQ